jgi:hypothetical protein
MFLNFKKPDHRIILNQANRAVVYTYSKDSGKFDIYLNCMLFQKENKDEYYARGLTKIIGPDNLVIIGKNKGEVFESETDISFWLQERDDNEASSIVKSYIDSKIDDCMSILKQCQEFNDAFTNAIGKELSQNKTYDNILKNYMERYAYKLPRMRS